MENKIVALPTSSQFRWTMLNIGLVDITGLDAKTTSCWKKGDWLLDLTLRYTYQLALDHTTPGGQTWGKQIPYVPRHSGSLDFSVRWRKWQLDWSTSLTGARWSRTANIPDYYLDPWSVTDLAASYSWNRFKLGLTCGNLFNKPYQIVQGYPMPGTNLKLNNQYNW